MRGVAALMIVLVHCNLVLGTQQMLPYGWLSVDLFFVLSGFVIALSYERRLCDGFGFANFMLARARRLLPVHFCAMALLTVVLCAIAAGHGFGPAVTVPAILTEALLNSLFIPDPISPVASAFAGLHSPFPLNPAQWSLWDEWIVNIGYALLLFAMRTRISALAGCLSAAIVLLAVFNVPQGWSVGAHHGDIQMGIFRALAGFTFGVVIFRLYQRGKLQRLPSIRPELLYLVWISACAIPPFAPKVLYECGVATILAPAIVALLVRSERKMPPLISLDGSRVISALRVAFRGTGFRFRRIQLFLFGAGCVADRSDDFYGSRFCATDSHVE